MVNTENNYIIEIKDQELSTKNLLWYIFNKNKLLLGIVILIEVIIVVCVSKWFSTMSLLLLALNKHDMTTTLMLFKKILMFISTPQIIRYFIQMPTLGLIYQNINRKSKNLAYDFFVRIKLNSLKDSDYLRVNLLGEYINSFLFNVLTLTRDRVQFFLITTITLLWSKPKLGLLFLVYVCVFLYLVNKFIKNLSKKSENISATRNNSKEFTSDLNRNFFLHKLFQLNKLNKKFFNEFITKENIALDENQKALQNYFLAASASNMFIMMGLIYYILISSSIMIEIKSILVMSIFNAIRDFNGFMLYFPMLFGEIGRIKDALTLFNNPQEEEKEKLIESNINTIHVDKVEFSYERILENNSIIKHQIFNNFSYKFYKGINILNGESGKGKSTLLKLIGGILETDKGNIIFNGKYSIQNYNVLDHISYVTQSELLFNRTVKENILLEKPIHNTYINYIQEFKMQNIENKIVGVNGSLLSGGESKRTIIGRMLCHYKPGNVLIFDEPFYGLDENLVKDIIQIIINFKNHIILVIDHTKSLENYLLNNQITFNVLNI